jgi:hypothetical protein
VGQCSPSEEDRNIRSRERDIGKEAMIREERRCNVVAFKIEEGATDKEYSWPLESEKGMTRQFIKDT